MGTLKHIFQSDGNATSSIKLKYHVQEMLSDRLAGVLRDAKRRRTLIQPRERDIISELLHEERNSKTIIGRISATTGPAFTSPDLAINDRMQLMNHTSIRTSTLWQGIICTYEPGYFY
ncbi:MAG: hypothetical protein C5B52_15205 [Bacteroidetes bacterium]|nr:MAG: hypothetical protein C5B52_15205 [Bacteroidota bacterium]